MTHSAYDDFLFAPIGDDRKDGVMLSVLSALARQGVDPWQEAARLAVLPGKTATQRLASMIAELPETSSADLDPGMIAARLIALLPRSTVYEIQSRNTLRISGAAPNPRAVIYVIFISFLFGALYVTASRQVPAQPDNAHAADSRAVAPQTPTVGSGQVSSGQ